MTTEEIRSLSDQLKGELNETHISWVILTKEFAFKIKKPLKFSFLDFSNLEKRRHYCSEEIRLNSRLSNIYLGLSYIEKGKNGFIFNEVFNESSIEVAVRMKRMADSDRLDNKLSNDSIDTPAIKDLARKIAGFHITAFPIEVKDDMTFVEKRFKDVLQVRDWIANKMGMAYLDIVDRSIQYHDKFIEEHAQIFDERVDAQFKRDLHGDLHTQNIFISDEPVVFDCIEFNERYRHIDVLNEIAFLCMDLEVRDRLDLSEVFLKSYLGYFDCLKNEEDLALFEYYKCYRANVKIKVIGLRAMQDDSGNEEEYVRMVKKYLLLMDKYLEDNPKQNLTKHH